MSASPHDPNWLDWFHEAPSTEAEDPGLKYSADELRQALSKLPLIEQQVIDMVLFQGMTKRAAAAAVGRAENTVAQRLEHSLGRLRWWMTLPKLGTPEEIREELSPILFEFEIDVLLSVIAGNTLRETSRQAGKNIGWAGWVAYGLKRNPSLPEKYKAYLGPRPGWPSQIRQKAFRQKRLNQP